MPDIKPASVSLPRQSEAAGRVQAAVNEARRRGHHVSADAEYTGVVLASTHIPTWERDPRTAVISPLGAVLLVAQPPIASMDDAIAVALGTQIEFHLGYELGVAGEVPSEALNRSPRAKLAGDGYRAGVEMRALLHRMESVPVARPAVETTDRIPALADAHDKAIGRAAAARVLDAFELSEVLDLVIELARARCDDLTDGCIREELMFVADALVELRDGAKDQGL